MSSEEHAQEFLEFVAKNEKRLKKNLRKNVTYDEDTFEDAFANTILKVHNVITRGTFIEDFESYFFMASRFEYINLDNKTRKIRNQHDPAYSNVGLTDAYSKEFIYNEGEWQEKEARNERINELFKVIAKHLNDVFDPGETDIFLIYYKLKAEKAGISYKKLSNITGKSLKEITTIIQKIKKYVRNNEDIQEMKRRLLNDVD